VTTNIDADVLPPRAPKPPSANLKKRIYIRVPVKYETHTVGFEETCREIANHLTEHLRDAADGNTLHHPWLCIEQIRVELAKIKHNRLTAQELVDQLVNPLIEIADGALALQNPESGVTLKGAALIDFAHRSKKLEEFALSRTPPTAFADANSAISDPTRQDHTGHIVHEFIDADVSISVPENGAVDKVATDLSQSDLESSKIPLPLEPNSAYKKLSGRAAVVKDEEAQSDLTPRRARTGYVQPGREGTKALVAYIDQDLLKTFKQVAEDSGVTMQDLVRGFVVETIATSKNPEAAARLKQEILDRQRQLSALLLDIPKR
jgi:hypothetical protein